MVAIKVDVSGIDEALKELEKLKKELPKMVLSAVRLGAQYERSNKKYRNRTGRLSRSTKGRLTRNNRTSIEAELNLGADYATYVRDMNLMNLSDTVNRIEAQIEDGINRLANRLG